MPVFPEYLTQSLWDFKSIMLQGAHSFCLPTMKIGSQMEHVGGFFYNFSCRDDPGLASLR